MSSSRPWLYSPLELSKIYLCVLKCCISVWGGVLSLPCLILHGATGNGTDMDIHLNVLVLTLQTLVYMVSEANDLKLVSFIQEKLSILVQKWFPELPLLYPEAGILSYMVSRGCDLICQLLFKALSWLCVPLPALLGGDQYFVSCLTMAFCVQPASCWQMW